MTWFLNRHPHSLVVTSLRAAVRDSADHAAAVGIWVVWLRADHVVACEWRSRLDIEAPSEVREEADAAVVIAIAPQRLTHSVSGRALVIGEFLESKGFRVEVVHVRVLREGALWTSLRGDVGGVVPAPLFPSAQSRLPFSGAALMSSRSMVAACAVFAALMFAAPAPAAPPNGQPGLITEPHSGGQAGVTAPPRPAAPAASGDGRQASPAMVSSETVPNPSTVQALPARPPHSSPERSQHSGSAQPRGLGSGADGEEVATDRDVVRLGAAELPRPDWLPASIAARERDWNAFLADRAAIAADQAGLVDPAIDAALGAIGGGQVPLPQELVLAPMVAADPQALVSVVSEVDVAVPELATQAADILSDALAQQAPA